jgi:hypothetical protein
MPPVFSISIRPVGHPDQESRQSSRCSWAREEGALVWGGKLLPMPCSAKTPRMAATLLLWTGLVRHFSRLPQVAETRGVSKGDSNSLQVQPRLFHCPLEQVNTSVAEETLWVHPQDLHSATDLRQASVARCAVLNVLGGARGLCQAVRPAASSSSIPCQDSDSLSPPLLGPVLRGAVICLSHPPLLGPVLRGEGKCLSRVCLPWPQEIQISVV